MARACAQTDHASHTYYASFPSPPHTRLCVSVVGGAPCGKKHRTVMLGAGQGGLAGSTSGVVVWSLSYRK